MSRIPVSLDYAVVATILKGIKVECNENPQCKKILQWVEKLEQMLDAAVLNGCPQRIEDSSTKNNAGSWPNG